MPEKEREKLAKNMMISRNGKKPNISSTHAQTCPYWFQYGDEPYEKWI